MSTFEQDTGIYGQVLSADGILPYPKRVIDLQQASIPSNAQEVRSFLGMVTYSSRYTADFATITVHLRNLTKKDVPLEWTAAHQGAHNKLIQALTSTPCMAYFDRKRLLLPLMQVHWKFPLPCHKKLTRHRLKLLRIPVEL